MSTSDALIDFIRTGHSFLIAGHLEPDGDCVGSQLALASFLRRLGKTAVVCNAGPWKRPEVKDYAPLFLDKIPSDCSAATRVIIVDCASLNRLDTLEKPVAALLGAGSPLAIIDHHEERGLEGLPAGTIAWIDGKACSVTALITRLVKAMGENLTREEAELLFLGLCTDTGFFRHADAGDDNTFLTAAELVACGVSPKKTYRAINGGKSLGSRILMGRILSRVKGEYGGRLLISREGQEESETLGQEGRDSDRLYELLQSVRGVEAIAIMRQESADKCTVGLRSQDRVDVASIARDFGGGGHYNAAGFSYAGAIAALEPLLIAAFAPQFPPSP